ncbi:MAG: MAPEG family protein [Gammaproteobacteria bacterium]|nr:MAPEG family protein [Gammaproteobacteria bacterium]
MTHILSDEVYWLSLTLLMTAVMWVPYILNRIVEQGGLAALWDPYGITTTKFAWAERMMRAHENAVENLVVFAPLVLLIEIADLNSPLSATACMVYFFARLTHFWVFTFAVPLLRVVTFLLGFAMQMILVARVFQLA